MTDAAATKYGILVFPDQSVFPPAPSFHGAHDSVDDAKQAARQRFPEISDLTDYVLGDDIPLSDGRRVQIVKGSGSA